MTLRNAMPLERGFRRSAWIVLLCLAMLGTGLISGSPVKAAFPGENGKIVFQSGDFIDDEIEDAEIWVMNPDGSEPTGLTDDTDDYEPAWSPDGTKIAFYSYREGDAEIWVMNADGSEETRLTEQHGGSSDGDFDPSWSPDGSKIVFESERDGDYEIFTMNPDGTEQTPITVNDTNEFEPQWSPDGSKIVFETDRDGRDPFDDFDIYSMNPDGSEQEPLTTDGEEFDPQWSPDGSQIVFASDRDDDDESHLYVMNADGSAQTRINNDDWSDFTPAWAPDDTKIVFGSARDDDGEIYISNPDGSEPVRLTEGLRDESEPDWQSVEPPDETPPETSIVSGPSGKKTKHSAKFAFTSSEANSTFMCRIDSKPFAPCTSPKRYGGLKLGKHKFKVVATDPAGNPDPTAAKRTWKVIEKPNSERG